MNCRKCGMEIPEGNKFCPNCGEKVEIVKEKVRKNLVKNLSDNDMNNQTNMNSSYSNDMNNQTNMNSNYSKNKSSVGKLIIVILIFILLLAGVLFLVFGIFKDEKHDYNTNIENIKHAMSNMVEASNNSGTLKVSYVASGNNLNMNLNGFIKYAKTNNGYDFQLGLDKSIISSEINAYMRLTNNDLTAYFPSSILNLTNNSYSNSSKYLKFNAKFSDFGDISLDSIINQSNLIDQEQINIKDLLIESNFKYIGKENGLEHYQIILNETFYRNLYSKYDNLDIDTYLDQMKNFNIEIYLNSKGNFAKITIDYSNFIEEANPFDKLVFTIEFTDFNSTTISIPQEVINNSVDINNYYNNNIFDYNSYDSIFDNNIDLTF